jgi:uncharacterized membrane protein (UPF0136 family)
MNIIYVINLVMTVIIMIVGLVGWRRSGKAVPLYFGIAFGLLALSHLATLLGLASSWEGLLIGIRLVAYLIVLYAVYKVAFGAKK